MSVFLGAHNIVSPLGLSSSENFEALLNGKSAVQKHLFDFSATPFFCSKLEESVLDSAFSSFGNKDTHTALEKMCILSIADVVKKSGLDFKEKNTLLILSTTKGNIDLLENNSTSIPQQRVYLSSFAKTVGDFFNCVNTPLVVSNACISGLLAMIIAKRLLENNNYKHIVVCGADRVSEFTLSGFKSFNALSDAMCKPFDASRVGINLGEAASSVLLSSDKLSNLIISAGASANDANHISGPSRTGDGLFQAISQTFKHYSKPTVDFISAHGTATEYNDEMESVAFSRAQLQSVPLHSLKAYYGHTLGAAGVLESVISLESLSRNVLIQSLGFETPGTSQTLNLIQKTESKNINSCLKTASGFGGCNAAAIFEKI